MTGKSAPGGAFYNGNIGGVAPGGGPTSTLIPIMVLRPPPVTSPLSLFKCRGLGASCSGRRPNETGVSETGPGFELELVNARDMDMKTRAEDMKNSSSDTKFNVMKGDVHNEACYELCRNILLF
jgi:hypothetical protein